MYINILQTGSCFYKEFCLQLTLKEGVVQNEIAQKGSLMLGGFALRIVFQTNFACKICGSCGF